MSSSHSSKSGVAIEKGRTTNDGATKQTTKVKDHHKEKGMNTKRKGP
jgi:hypothetical protein